MHSILVFRQHMLYDQSLQIRSDKADIFVQPLNPSIIRLQVRPHGGRSSLNFKTPAVIRTEWEPFAVQLEETEDVLRLYTGELTVEVAKSPLRLRFFDSEGRLYAEDHPDGGFAIEDGENGKVEKVSWTLAAPQDAHYYGFGQRTGHLDKRGQRMNLWATDEPLHTPGTDELYQAIPFFLTLWNGRAYGIFLDSPARVTYDIGKSDPTAASMSTAQGELDAYFIAGPHPKDVIRRYTELTGRMELPPKWALGYQQSRYSYMSEEEVRGLAREFRARKIPCDVIYLDIDYMDGYRVFTFDGERFPDPARMVRDLSDAGFKVVTIVDPGVKVDGRYRVFQEGIRDGHFVCYPNGELFIGTVWPGRTAFPDFTREETRRWWGELHREFIQEIGIAGIWNDMNEPSCFARNTMPDEVLQGEDGAKFPHGQVHNLYGMQMAQATYEGLRRLQPDRRPFILTRSGYAGIQRYAAVWMGDNHSWWEHLLTAMPMLMGMGLSGVPFVGTDVGGFQGDVDAELLIRWTQFGTFSPFFRNHSAVGTRYQEPWAFGDEAEAIIRRFIELRYRLLPYFYQQFRRSSLTGLPIMRPLLLEYSDDPETYRLSDQFLIGEELLVAPVYMPGQKRRLVYLPRGEWVDFWTGKRLQGPAHIVAEAPLERIPLYVRVGTVLPLGPAIQYVGEPAPSELTFMVYAGAEGTLDLYEDDGETYAYTEGAYAITPVQLKRIESGWQLTVGDAVGGYRPAREYVTVRVYLPTAMTSSTPASHSKPHASSVEVRLDGHAVPFEIEPDHSLSVRVTTPGARGFTLSVIDR